MADAVTVRDATPADEAAWRALWAGYCAFYETSIGDATTAATWRRLLDPTTPMGCLVACDGAGPPAGFTNYVVHPITWSRRPVCYLEDLFVAPAQRGTGLGRALIAALAERGRQEGWLRLYWNTADDNRQARMLYDKVATQTRWVRYDLGL